MKLYFPGITAEVRMKGSTNVGSSLIFPEAAHLFKHNFSAFAGYQENKYLVTPTAAQLA